jgi:6-phosphofructokinase 1
MNTLLVVSGGDAPGINTFLYEYTRLMSPTPRQNIVLGAVGGFAGVLSDHILRLNPKILTAHRGLGGSYLASSRDPVLKDATNRTRFGEILSQHDVDNVILLGGDGSLRNILPTLRELGVACIGIPATIDNDVPGTEQTLGFDTACNFAHHTLDGLLATARALPGRVFSVETLGGNTGMLALDIAYAAGAHAVLVPEYAYDAAWLVERVEWALQRDRFALIVLSEGIANARTFAEDFQERSGHKVRDTRLGHGQRAVAPSHRDRMLAISMAAAAHDALHSGVTAGTIVVRVGQIALHEGSLADLPAQHPNRRLYNAVNGLEK